MVYTLLSNKGDGLMSPELLERELTENHELLRERTQEQAKAHKASWIKLGQYLYTVYKDKIYKEWGFLAFDTYCGRELGIRSTTASKLLKSYYFLEKKEPQLVQTDFTESQNLSKIPNYESVNLLRLASNNKNLTEEDIDEIRENVIEKIKEPKEVRSQVKQLLEERDNREPSEIRRQKRNATIKRLTSTLISASVELGQDRLLPDYLLKQMNELVEKLKDQIEE